jgi:hypothetical protein
VINTVREKLLKVVIARLAALSLVGTLPGGGKAVIEPGTLDPTDIADVLSAGKFVLEIITTDDERVPRQNMQFETLEFELGVIAYCPKLENRTPSSVAADIHGEVYVALAGTAEVPPQEPGTNKPAFQIDGFALSCELLGGGAAGIDPDTRAHQGFSAFVVTYRHVVGDPTQ